MIKIVVVDDDLVVSAVIMEILGKNGYEAEHVSNGNQALEKLEQYHPDLIITDIMMPKMDGWELCKKIRENHRTKSIPVLMITAKCDQATELRSFECGANEFIAKPFEKKEFLETIERLTCQKK